ncbi:MAG TPA: hypothetical protein VN282_28030 [Pyrinomonadaceae bacterium]|nr:hypothetical protein [Pyrinomonadaceae bacterium]
MDEENPLQKKEKSLCFVIMPFKQEVYYFFLYIQLYIETEFGIRCERGDTHGSTTTIDNKVEEKICEADVIIADCTDNNPNVFFELGIAYKARKEVILIAQDRAPKKPDLPTDISNRDVLFYNFDNHEDFIRKLHDLLHSILHPNPIDLLYLRYTALVAKANQRFSTPWNILSKADFKKLLEADYRTTQQAGRRQQGLILPALLDPQNTIPPDEIRRLLGGRTH